MVRGPPRYTLFPYTTLFLSKVCYSPFNFISLALTPTGSGVFCVPPSMRLCSTNFCSKYRMGYVLTDGSVDLHFTVMTVLHSSFKAQRCQNWEISDLGLIKYALGISISRDNAGCYFGVSLHYYAACS